MPLEHGDARASYATAFTDEQVAQIREIIRDELRAKVNHRLPVEVLHGMARKLDSAGARQTCPLCDCDRWTIRAISFPGSQFALARVCMRCWYMQFFDIEAADL